jgi:pyruvate kinase
MKDVDKRLSFAQQLAVDSGFLSPGQPVVIVTGWRSGSGYTNTLRVTYYDPEGEKQLPQE